MWQHIVQQITSIQKEPDSEMNSSSSTGESQVAQFPSVVDLPQVIDGVIVSGTHSASNETAAQPERQLIQGPVTLSIKTMIELPLGLLWCSILLLLMIRLLNIIVTASHNLLQPALFVILTVTILAAINIRRRFAVSWHIQPTSRNVSSDDQFAVPMNAARNRQRERGIGAVAQRLRQHVRTLPQQIGLVAGVLVPQARMRLPAPWQRVFHIFVVFTVLMMGLATPVEGKGSPLLAILTPDVEDLPPPVPNPEVAQLYAGQEIVYLGLSDPKGAALDATLARRFERDTGIRVKVIPRALSATENYATYQRLFQTQSTDIDVYALDIIWMKAFAPHLVDLGPKLGEIAEMHIAGVVQNSFVDGRLVAMPRADNLGLLYYRSDLLQAYGYSQPPQTWDELEEMARTIQAGERDGGNANFWGFVWQGAPYEGLTCNALEWIASQGGGALIEDGQVTINNTYAVQALQRAQRWVGTISPHDVTVAKEEDSRQIFQNGNAAFMRNWPYVYAALKNSNESGVSEKFAVAPLPRNAGQASVGAVGGDQLGVSIYSRHSDAAIEFVRYMTSPEVQKWRAVVGSYVPTIQSVQSDLEVRQMLPFLEQFQRTQRVIRPSDETGERYNQASTSVFVGVNRVLFGADATEIVPQVARDLQHDMSEPPIR
jgi:trehalose/maltose transport system substrate-binding protein